MQGKRILLVEDEKMMREGVRAFLESKGYVVTEAEDGVQALKEFANAINGDSRDFLQDGRVWAKGEQRGIDLVILDVMLPKKNGIEVLREIRKKMKCQS